MEAEPFTVDEFMKVMFPASVHRGPHAWGWMTYDGTSSIDINKFEGRSDTDTAIAEMKLGANQKVDWLVGHVRWATHGEPDIMVNNHPIIHDNIIGVHNGILSNYEKILAVTGRHDETAEVDSEAIFAAVNKWGHKRGLSKVLGDMVSVYVDKRYPGTLRIARTNGRSLYVCHTAAGSMIFASEKRIIDKLKIEHDGYSAVSTYRLLNVKGGKVIRRADLERPIVVPTRRYSSSEAAAERFVFKPRKPFDVHPKETSKVMDDLDKRLKEIRQRAASNAAWDIEMDAPDIPHVSVRKTPRQNQKVKANGVMEPGTELYWLDGYMVDLDTYIDSTVGD